MDVAAVAAIVTAAAVVAVTKSRAPAETRNAASLFVVYCNREQLMGSALMIVSDSANPHEELCAESKWLARAEPELADIARKLGVTSLMEFFSADKNVVREFLDEEEIQRSETLQKLPDECWFPASEGLKTIRVLIEYVQKTQLRTVPTEKALADLREFERALVSLERNGRQWHLGVDF